ncbi:MAG: trypsin-like peptidase domain-containing protein [Planctomycetota bacterium]|nr:trypsin-like peptidase domain-containing protein [Planctomycetota bacterium]
MVEVQLSNDTAKRLLKTLIALGSKKTAISKDRKRVIRKLAGRFNIDFFEIATADGNPLKSRPTDPSECKAFYLCASVVLGVDAEDHDFRLLEKLAKIYKLGSAARKLDFKARGGEEALAGITCEGADEPSEESLSEQSDEQSDDLEDLKRFMKTEDSDEQSKGVFELIDEDELAEVVLVEAPKKEPLKAKKVTKESKSKTGKKSSLESKTKKVKKLTTESTTKKSKAKGTGRTRSVDSAVKKTGTRRGSKLTSRTDSSVGTSKDKKTGRGDKRPTPKKSQLTPLHWGGVAAGILVLLIVISLVWPDPKPTEFAAGTELTNYNKLVERWNETQKTTKQLEFNELRDLRKNITDLAKTCDASDNPEVKNAGAELRKLLGSSNFRRAWDDVVETELTNLVLAVSEDRNKEQFNKALKRINDFPVEVLSSPQMKTQFNELKRNVSHWAAFSKQINKIIADRPVTLTVLERAEQFCVENKASRATAAYDRLMRWFTKQSGTANAVYEEFLTAFYAKNKTRSATMIRILRKIKGNNFNSYFNQQISATLAKLDPKRPKPGFSISTGTGFYITADTIITNAHVVGTLSTVTVYAGSSKVDGIVIAKDKTLDLAIIRVRRRGLPLVYCPSSIRAGTTAFAYGYGRLGRNNSTLLLTRGSVSAVRQADIVFDGKINPGNSGGPLIDADGRWLGVVVAKTRSSSDVDSLGFAIHGRSVVTWLKKNNISVSSTQRLPKGRVPPSSIRSSIVRIESINLGR